MAHFAKLIDDVVVQVVVVSNDVAVDEATGAEFLVGLLGPATWVQCSFNGTIRKQFPAAGYRYDQVNDVFIAPMPPGEGWELNDNYEWVNDSLPEIV
jgi:hypothetical protein